MFGWVIETKERAAISESRKRDHVFSVFVAVSHKVTLPQLRRHGRATLGLIRGQNLHSRLDIRQFYNECQRSYIYLKEFRPMTSKPAVKETL